MESALHIDDTTSAFCRNGQSVSSLLASNPAKSAGDIAKYLYGSNQLATVESPAPEERKHATPEDLACALQCGNFGDTKPSELFLRAFHDVLCSLHYDPLAGVVSPSLIGSTGVVPVTIIGPLHDCTRHMSNTIARAKHEVLLASNFWKASEASAMISDGIRELSRRAGERGERAIVKLMYDRGNIKQFIEPHVDTPPSGYTSENVKLPSPEEIPYVDLKVVNYHKPPLGTFHAKFMIVDRELALVGSNNIMDNDNTEMLVQYEGPIVDSIWDTFLISWHKALDPPPPYLNSPAASRSEPTFAQQSFRSLFSPNGEFRLPENEDAQIRLAPHLAGDPHFDADVAGEIRRLQAMLTPTSPGQDWQTVIATHLNAPTKINVKPTAPERTSGLRYFPIIPTAPTTRVPMAMVNRKPYASPIHKSLYVPQNESFLSLVRNAQRTIFIQTPDLNSEALLPSLIEAVRRGVELTYYVCLGYNDAGELLPNQGGTNEMAANRMLAQLDTPEEIDRMRIFFYVAADQDHPIHNQFKQRSCHVKLMIVDDTVAVQGSGNQDTQSWYQSQEVNVMVDSPEICRSWREAVDRNQNTAQYGRTRNDGCWYDNDGTLAAGSSGTDAGHFSWAKGIIGAVKKARGQ